MNLSRKTLILCALLITVVACRKAFLPDAISVDNNYLVVEGVINSGNDSTIIKLSRTIKLDSTNRKKEKGAAVSVEGDNNTKYLLQELREGYYVTTGLNLPVVNKYRLHIITAENKEYLSDFVENKITPPIDSIAFVPAVSGVNFYAYAHDNTNNTRYYRWDYDESWTYFSLLPSIFIYENGEVSIRPLDSVLTVCYKHATPSNNVFVGSTTKLTSDVVSKQPVGYVDAKSGKIHHVYSFNLRQYALTSDAYAYWEQLKKNTEQLGSIFDAQPSVISTNIHSVNNNEEPVIGYISVSTIIRKRIFIAGRDLPFYVSYIRDLPDIEDCKAGVILLEPKSTLGERLSRSLSKGDTLLTGPLQDGTTFKLIGYGYATAPCVDCRLSGGSIIKPAYWP
jgi:hypothetical protein